MRIVIAGDGQVGSALAEMLANEGHEIVVIDSNKKILREAVEQLDIMVVHGNGASLEVQQEAEVGNSHLFIAVTSADETNILCCILARKLGCDKTIARVRNPDYIQQMVFLKDELGLNLAVNPERSAAAEVFQLLQFPSFLQRDTFAKGRVEIVQIAIDQKSHFADKKLSSFHKKAQNRMLVCAVERDGILMIPNGNFRLQPNDRAYITAKPTDLAKLIRSMNIDQHRMHYVIIIGGGNTSYYLAKKLLDAGTEVKIIEKQKEKCIKLAELLPRAIVLHGDGGERALLDAEGIENADAVVTLTNRDEENLTISMYADYAGVSKVITKLDHTEYLEVFKDRGIATVVSPKKLISRQIAQYVHAMYQSMGVPASTIHQIGSMQAIEFDVDEHTHYVGKKLSAIELRDGVLITSIIRKEKTIIPRGNDVLKVGDTVIIVTTEDTEIDRLNDIFV